MRLDTEHIWRWFEMRCRSDYYSPDALAAHIGNINNVKSRGTEVNQSD